MDIEPTTRLVQFEANDGLQLDGSLAYADSSTTIIHVHGRCGNFYTNEFIQAMNESYPTNGINFLTFNHRGHDCIAEGYQHEDLVYIGGSLETFEETMKDIKAAVEFASKFSDQVILQGHSGGCEKVLYYNYIGEMDYDVILLGPADSKDLQRRYIDPETLTDQYERLQAQRNNPKLWNFVDPDEFGIYVDGKEYVVPMTRSAMIDLHEGPAFQILNYNQKWPNSPLDINLLACIGSQDSLMTHSFDKIRRGLKQRANHTDVEVISGGNHHFEGQLSELTECIVDWVTTS